MQLARLEKDNVHVATPNWILKWIRATFGEFHDPCPLDWTPEGEIPCGLTSEWKPFNYVNPPYRDAMKWLNKGYEEAKQGKRSLFLVPLRITSKYFRQYVCERASKVWLMVGRVRFKGYEKGIPQTICLVLYEKKEDPDKPATIDWFFHDKLWR